MVLYNMLLIQELSVHICVIYAILDKWISCNEVPILVMALIGGEAEAISRREKAAS